MKTLIIVVSLLMNIWFSTIIIKLERFHYSTQIGMCSERIIDKDNNVIRQYQEKQMYKCLSQTEPRTSGLWDLYYGLTNK